MLKYILLFSVFTGAAQLGQAQKMVGNRYKDLVFPDVSVQKDLSYAGDGVSDKSKTYQYDIYQPAGDQAARRPLIIWMHGGGFKFGSKNDKDISLWCRSFAQRGYVCAAINYSLHKGNFSFKYDVLKKDCYKAVDDLKSAIAYFKLNAARYHIDTSKIILAGNSAGGMIALQAAYCNPSDLRKLGQVNDPALPSKSFSRD
jgi:acetyl esterase/lipase